MKIPALLLLYVIALCLLIITLILMRDIPMNWQHLNYSITEGEIVATNKQKKDAPEVQIPLLQIEEQWKEHYNGMPSFKQEDCMPYKTVMVHFAERKDMIGFSKLVKQPIELSTKYIWYPESEIQVRDMQWISENPDEEIIDGNS